MNIFFSKNTSLKPNKGIKRAANVQTKKRQERDTSQKTEWCKNFLDYMRDYKFGGLGNPSKTSTEQGMVVAVLPDKCFISYIFRPFIFGFGRKS